MTFSPFDSPIYSVQYGDPEVRALFTDSAEVRAILLVEGMLAKVQGELGVIPLESALYIHRASMEVQIDPAGLATGMAETGNPISAMVAAFAKAMEAPEHSKFIHWEVSAQSVIDTALILRLRQYLRIIHTRLDGLKSGFNNQEFSPFALHLEQLVKIRNKLIVLQFDLKQSSKDQSDEMFKMKAALAKALKLPSPQHGLLRNDIVEFFDIVSQITKSLVKLGQAGPETIHSTVLSTMARYTESQADLLNQATVDQRCELKMILALEKLTLGQVCIALGVATKHAQILAGRISAA